MELEDVGKDGWSVFMQASVRVNVSLSALLLRDNVRGCVQRQQAGHPCIQQEYIRSSPALRVQSLYTIIQLQEPNFLKASANRQSSRCCDRKRCRARSLTWIPPMSLNQTTLSQP